MKKCTAIVLSAAMMMGVCFAGISTDVKAAETEANEVGEDAGASAGDSDQFESFAKNAAKAKNAQKSTWTDNADFDQYEIGTKSFSIPKEWAKEDEDPDGTLYFETDTAMLMVMYDELGEEIMKEVDLTDKIWQDSFIGGMQEEIDMNVLSQEAKTYKNVMGFETIAEADIEGYDVVMDMVVVQDDLGLYEFLIYNFTDDASVYSEDLNKIVDTLGDTTDAKSVGDMSLEGITKNAKNMDAADTKMAITSTDTVQYQTSGMYLVDVSKDWEPMENDDPEDPSIYFMNDNAMLQINFGKLDLMENAQLDLTDAATQKELMEAVCGVDELGLKASETKTVKLSGMDGFTFNGPANIGGTDIDFEAVILHNKSEGLYMFYVYNFSGESGLYQKELETIADSLTILQRAK